MQITIKPYQTTRKIRVDPAASPVKSTQQEKKLQTHIVFYYFFTIIKCVALLCVCFAACVLPRHTSKAVFFTFVFFFSAVSYVP